MPALNASSAMLTDALSLFAAFRAKTGTASLHKAPGTAELLNWIQILRSQGFDEASGLRRKGTRDQLVYSLRTLTKTKDDSGTGAKFVDAWLAAGPPTGR
jgi:hypothetical protein